jgi:hypothetical protein
MPLIQSPISEKRLAIGRLHVLPCIVEPVDGDLRVDLGIPVARALSHQQLAHLGVELPPVAVVARWSFDGQIVEVMGDGVELHLPLDALEARHHPRRLLSDLDEADGAPPADELINARPVDLGVQIHVVGVGSALVACEVPQRHEDRPSGVGVDVAEVATRQDRQRQLVHVLRFGF